MAYWVALLRGVNVGGNNKVPMAQLRALAEGLGWENVQSYIASGNLVFETEGSAVELASELSAAMQQELGIDVPILVLPGAAIHAALADCPYQPEKPNLVHGFFLWAEPVLDEALLEALRRPSEAFEVRGAMAWLHTPEGFSTSKLADRIDRVLGVKITARNLNTIGKLASMLPRDEG